MKTKYEMQKQEMKNNEKVDREVEKKEFIEGMDKMKEFIEKEAN